jgi:hypothetical protein
MLGGANAKAYNSNLAAMNDQLAKGNGAVAGVAEQQATLNGKLADAKGAWSGLLDQWGQKLLPKVTELAGKLQDLSTWVGNNQTKVKDFAVVVGIGTVAVKLATAAQWAWNLAMEANPVGATIMGIAAAAAGAYLLWQHLDLLGPTFIWLGHAWDNMRIAGLRALQWLENGLLNFVDVFVHGADQAFGWIPLLGPQIHKAALAFEKFKNDSNASLEGMIHDIKVNADFKPIMVGYSNLAATIGRPLTIPVALAGMASSTASAPSANSLLGLLYPGGKPTATANTYVNVGMRASGGPIESGAPYIVGEKGPELIVPRQSGHVVDAASTRAMAGASHGPAVHIEHYHEGSKSGLLVAADLMFRKAAAG